MVEQLFLAVPRGCLQFVIVVFPDRTHFLYLLSYRCLVSVNVTHPQGAMSRSAVCDFGIS